MKITWKHLAPVVVAVAIALIPAPEGLPQHAWYFFANFVGVTVGLMFEPLPGGAIIGIIFFVVFTVISVPWVLARGEPMMVRTLLQRRKSNGTGCRRT